MVVKCEVSFAKKKNKINISLWSVIGIWNNDSLNGKDVQ